MSWHSAAAWTSLSIGRCAESSFLWSKRRGEVLGELHVGDLVASSLSISPDGSTLAACTLDGTLRWWDLTDAAAIAEQGYVRAPQQLNQVSINRSGALVAAACDDGAVYVWRLADGELVATLRHSAADAERLVRRLPCVSFSPDGQRLASGSTDGTVRIWKALSAVGSRPSIDRGKPRADDPLSGGDGSLVLRGHENSVRALAFSPDGQWLASGADDLSVRIWNTETGEVQRILHAATERVHALRFSPDGLILAAAGTDGQIVFFDALEGRQLLLLDAHLTPVMSLDFSSDGDHFAASYPDGRVKVWDLRHFDAHMNMNRH